VGVPGELIVGGDGVSRGYMNNPELTSGKFVISHQSLVNDNFTNDQCPMTNDLFYRTGDLARRLVDGTVEFLGRIDHQVKIRGFRVEVGEIENHLLKHKDIKETVVIPKVDETGDKYLCAYYVPAGTDSPGKEELAAYLSRFMPGYMIPLYFFPLEKMPLTPNGKVDREALPAPEVVSGTQYVAPGDEVERKLAEIWARALGINKEKIGIHDNFFELGGQSLKATMLIAGVHKAFNVKVPLAKFFKIPCIRALAQYIKTAARDKYIAVEPTEKKEYYPMSSAQKRLYVLQEINPGSINYNMPLMLMLEGTLEREILEKAFRELIQRHESLRTSFRLINDEPFQEIHENVEFKIEYSSAKKHFVRPFDLSEAPFLRVRLVKTGEQMHMLMVDMHHVISDGKSHEIFLGELLAFYRGEALPELRLQYKDFSQWQDTLIFSGELRKQEAYWVNQLKGDSAPLKIPTDYPRSEQKRFEGAVVTFEIAREEADRLRALAKREDATMFMIILTIFNILLFKLSRRQDIIVGTIVAGRRHPDLENIIGMFINTLVLRNDPGKDKTFIEFLGEVKTNTLEAFDRQDYQFDDLVDKLGIRRDAARNPLFDVLFLFNSLDKEGILKWEHSMEMEIPGLKIKPCEDERGQAKFDLLFTGMDTGAGDNLVFDIEYSTELFKKEKIERFITYFRQISSAVIENESIPLKDIKISHDLAAAVSDLYQRDESVFDF
jgi:tyrocidine synthetase-3